MIMTVKNLITELQKIENKFLEIKVTTPDWKIVDIEFIKQAQNARYVYIRTKAVK
jgi:hypothetical protein